MPFLPTGTRSAAHLFEEKKLHSARGPDAEAADIKSKRKVPGVSAGG
jgi:hypothetical protein